MTMIEEGHFKMKYKESIPNQGVFLSKRKLEVSDTMDSYEEGIG